MTQFCAILVKIGLAFGQFCREATPAGSAAGRFPKLRQLNRCAQVDPLENRIEARITAETFVPHRDRQSRLEIGGKIPRQQGDLEFIQQIKEPLTPAHTAAAALLGRILGLDRNQRFQSAENGGRSSALGLGRRRSLIEREAGTTRSGTSARIADAREGLDASLVNDPHTACTFWSPVTAGNRKPHLPENGGQHRFAAKIAPDVVKRE
jgi:hypothetical protein